MLSLALTIFDQWGRYFIHSLNWGSSYVASLHLWESPVMDWDFVLTSFLSRIFWDSIHQIMLMRTWVTHAIIEFTGFHSEANSLLLHYVHLHVKFESFPCCSFFFPQVHFIFMIQAIMTFMRCPRSSSLPTFSAAFSPVLHTLCHVILPMLCFHLACRLVALTPLEWIWTKCFWHDYLLFVSFWSIFFTVHELCAWWHVLVKYKWQSCFKNSPLGYPLLCGKVRKCCSPPIVSSWTTMSWRNFRPWCYGN